MKCIRYINEKSGGMFLGFILRSIFPKLDRLSSCALWLHFGLWLIWSSSATLSYAFSVWIEEQMDHYSFEAVNQEILLWWSRSDKVTFRLGSGIRIRPLRATEIESGIRGTLVPTNPNRDFSLPHSCNCRAKRGEHFWASRYICNLETIDFAIILTQNDKKIRVKFQSSWINFINFNLPHSSHWCELTISVQIS